MLPTPVGVVRRETSPAVHTSSAPHARGGGPARMGRVCPRHPVLPTPVGWSGSGTRAALAGEVLPTPVGVVRRPARRGCSRNRAPHARGVVRDGRGSTRMTERAPHARGVVRCSEASFRPVNCAPHARGGGPDHGAPTPQGSGCSPRPWGWSVAGHAACGCRRVLPTPVGVVRSQCLHDPTDSRAPHARGGGPLSRAPRADLARCSPRPWGWSGRSVAGLRKFTCSPRPWGWSDAEPPR